MRKLLFIAPALFLLPGCRLEPPPSLLLVTLDTVRADRLGSYGSSLDLTPRLDALASESIRFADVTSQTPLTTPSHASIFTGLLPTRHGVRNNELFRLGESTPTLATVLRAAGYRTAAFIGAFPLESRHGLDRGFDLYDEEFLRRSRSQERSAGAVLDAAEGFLRANVASKQPFFLWVHLFDAHTPYEAPEPFRTRYPDDAYGAEIAYLDDALGNSLDSLRRDGLLDRLVVSVVADHGEALGEHGESTHGTLVYESTLRIPWLLRLPKGALGGLVVHEPVRAIDVAPTLLGLLEAPALEDVDGIDLSPFLESGIPGLAVYSETLYLNLLLGWAELRSLRRGSLKVIEGARQEAFDLASDPEESANVFMQRRPEAEGLLRELREAGADAAPAPTLGADETAERLAALGYVSGSTPRRSEGRDPRDGMDIWREIEAGTSLIARDPPGARERFENALLLDPGNGLILKCLGDVALVEGRAVEALNRYREALASGFTHADLELGLARALEATGEREEAEKAVERFLSRRPDSSDGLLLKGRLLRARGMAAKAEVELRRALEAVPADGSVWNELGSVLADLGRRGEAREAFEQAMESAPEAAEPRRNLAVLLEGSEAEALLHEAIRLDAAYAEARIDLARTLAETGRIGEANSEIRIALRLDPDNPEALFIAARVAELGGRKEEARRFYLRFLAVAPETFAGPREMASRRLAALKGSK